MSAVLGSLGRRLPSGGCSLWRPERDPGEPLSVWAARNELLNLVGGIVTLMRPNVVVETGVALGFSTATILAAMRENDQGHLYSVDLPAVQYGHERETGSAVPAELRDRWTLARPFTEGAAAASERGRADRPVHPRREPRVLGSAPRVSGRLAASSAGGRARLRRRWQPGLRRVRRRGWRTSRTWCPAPAAIRWLGCSGRTRACESSSCPTTRCLTSAGSRRRSTASPKSWPVEATKWSMSRRARARPSELRSETRLPSRSRPGSERSRAASRACRTRSSAFACLRALRRELRRRRRSRARLPLHAVAVRACRSPAARGEARARAHRACRPRRVRVEAARRSRVPRHRDDRAGFVSEPPKRSSSTTIASSQSSVGSCPAAESTSSPTA